MLRFIKWLGYCCCECRCIFIFHTQYNLDSIFFSLLQPPMLSVQQLTVVAVSVDVSSCFLLKHFSVNIEYVRKHTDEAVTDLLCSLRLLLLVGATSHRGWKCTHPARPVLPSPLATASKASAALAPPTAGIYHTVVKGNKVLYTCLKITPLVSNLFTRGLDRSMSFHPFMS